MRRQRDSEKDQGKVGQCSRSELAQLPHERSLEDFANRVEALVVGIADEPHYSRPSHGATNTHKKRKVKHERCPDKPMHEEEPIG